LNLLRYSAIVPTFNGARWLGRALGSVLRQTLPATEIIVVNDGSTDETADVLAAFGNRIRCLHTQRGGIGAARNLGSAAASGTYLAFLDHDDLWHEEKMEQQARYLAQHPEVDVLYTDAREFDSRGTVHASYHDRFPRLRSAADLFSAIVHFQVPLVSTVCLRRAFLTAHDLSFMTAASGVDDIGLFLEIAARGGVFAHLDEVLVSRRLHDSNLSKEHWHRFVKRCVLYRELLDRLSDAPASYRRELCWGLRQAHYQVGEWRWGHGQRAEAAALLRQAVGWDSLGIRARCLAWLCLLPAWLTNSLQRCKRWLWKARP
jgi:glycosyltransferase involved in cell wall biosynthesis